MSLNAAEQMIFDYVQSHPEERHYWVEKVRTTLAQAGDEHVAAARLALELWRYYEERSAVVQPFKGHAEREGARRISMKNLAEHLLRLWTPPRRKQPAPPPLA